MSPSHAEREARLPLNVLLGIPDDAQGVIRVSGDGKRLVQLSPEGGGRFRLRGGTNIIPYISTDRFFVKLFYLQKGVGLRAPIADGPFVNHIADPDICRGALDVAVGIIGKLSRPCFNHPDRVLANARHDVVQALAGVPGLIVPKTIRVAAATPAAVRDGIARNGLDFPVLVRVAGTHAGKALIKIDGAHGLDDVVSLHADIRSAYVTEFRDFAARDGRYRKFRVAVVGDEILLRHCIIADDWLLHAPRRARDTDSEERAMFEAFDGPWSAHLHPLFREIGRRLGLDYFGVDCSINDEGRVLLFEANACMSILLNTSPSPNMWDTPIARIAAALERRLTWPSSWYGPRSLQPIAAP
jgi:hypothetical protein